jgi:hypothetical protein
MALVEALQWAVNQGNHVGIRRQVALRRRAARAPAGSCCQRLAVIGFTGVVQLDCAPR